MNKIQKDIFLIFHTDSATLESHSNCLRKNFSFGICLINVKYVSHYSKEMANAKTDKHTGHKQCSTDHLIQRQKYLIINMQCIENTATAYINFISAFQQFQ